ncbi:hypothetical protein [Nonlabens antarcticus]|nr:hypothetical protein [Nonlabens antarcticus]
METKFQQRHPFSVPFFDGIDVDSSFAKAELHSISQQNMVCRTLWHNMSA